MQFSRKCITESRSCEIFLQTNGSMTGMSSIRGHCAVPKSLLELSSLIEAIRLSDIVPSSTPFNEPTTLDIEEFVEKLDVLLLFFSHLKK